ncbi:MAG: glycoside hydrolase family 36 protein [Bacteroidales bacterium]
MDQQKTPNLRSFLLQTFLFLFCCFSGGMNAQDTQAFRAVLDTKEKTFSIFDGGQQLLISGAQLVIHTSSGDYYSSDKEFRWSKPDRNTWIDALGMCEVAGFSSIHRKAGFELTYTTYAYSGIKGLVVEVKLKNISGREIEVYSIEPIHSLKNEGGFVGGSFTKALLNGAMYYDPGRIHELGTPYVKGSFYGETKGGKFRSQALDDDKRTVNSWWNISLFSSYAEEGLSIGYLGNEQSLGRIKWLKVSDSTNSLVVESVYSEGLILSPGASISSDRVLISTGKDPYETLEIYAEAIGKANQALTGNVINGWCNWFYTHENFSQEEVLKNAKIASKELLPYGMETIQIDEGYQLRHGDWQGNRRFPDGLKAFADSIRFLGLKPGIWIAPFVISEGSWVYTHHPEWLLKRADGSLQRIGPWPGEDTDWYKNESPKRYGLDITHPAAERWFTALMDSMVHVYGFELIKIDFVAWTVFSAEKFYDASASPAAVYRKALAIMHRVGGDQCHILDCGPGQVSVGNIHSMRIEYDQNYGFFPEVWNQYIRNPASSAGALGKRYYYHNRSWTNDIDHICIALVPYAQAEAIVSLIALSGGNTMSGDRLVDLEISKLELLKKAFPSSGISARPVNLLERDPQTVFAVPCKKGDMQWTVAGFFNPDTAHSTTYEYSLDRLWLDPSKHYLVFDFWKEQFAGEISGKIQTRVDPGGVNLLAIHEKTGFPQVLSSTRHVLQGLIENEGIQYDSLTNTLTGRYLGPKGSRNRLYIYLPEGYYWDAAPGKLFRDEGLYTIKYAERNILRLDFRFEGVEEIGWKVELKKVQ